MIERRKGLLVTHVGTVFSIFAPDVRAAQLRPLLERIVAQLAPARALPSTRSASFTQTG